MKAHNGVAGAKLVVTVIGNPVLVISALDDLKLAVQECASECDLLDMIEIREENL